MSQILYNNITVGKRLIGPSVQEGEMAIPSLLVRPSSGQRAAIPINRYPLVTVKNPQIVGPTALPSVLTILSGIYDGSPQPSEFTYQWLRDDIPIAGETGLTYTTVYLDFNTEISVLETATSALGSIVNQTNKLLITVFEDIVTQEFESYAIVGIPSDTALVTQLIDAYVVSGIPPDSMAFMTELEIYTITEEA